MSSRKRRHEDSDNNEEYEDGRITSGDEEEEGEIDVKSRKKKSKKSKKHKKDKRGHHHKSKKRSRKRSEDEDGGAESGSATDKEGGSTPEIEAGEVLEISEDENVIDPRSNADDGRSRSSSTVVIDPRSNADDGRSRSSSAVRGKRGSRRSSRSRSRSRSRDQQQDSPQSFKREKSYTPPPISKKNRDSNNKSLKSRKSPSPAGLESSSKGSSESLSIEETNKLRATLGLAPLKVETKNTKSEESNDKDDDQKEGKLIPNSTVRHKPAENLTEKSATEKMRFRLQQRKMKRQQENKLLTVSTLGADNDVDDTSKWLARQKKKEKEKKAAEKRAKMLEELDNDFGVGNIVKEDASKTKASSYGSGNLAGITVQHDANKFHAGKAIILTLKDADILDEKMEDTLINVNMVDDELVDKNKENLKKSKSGYNPYDQEEIDEETGELRQKNMLDKYDEEIDGETKKSFVIGNQGTFSEAEEVQRRREEIRKKLAKRNVESLETPQHKVASDYYTEEEVVKFKKPKKKKKVKRKMLKADDLLALNNDVNTEQSRIKKEYSRDEGTRGSMPMDMDEEDVKPKINDEDLSKIRVDDDDLDLQFALNKARRLKQRKQFDNDDRNAKFLEENGLNTIKKETVDNDDDDAEVKDEFQSLDQSTGAEFISTFADDKQTSNIILNETSEFCRHLGAWRSHEASGLGESVSKDILDFEQSLTGISKFEKQRSSKNHASTAAGAGVTSSEDEDDPMEGEGARRFKRDAFSSLIDQEDKQAVILDDEPDLQSGVAAAIKLANNKGYWETEDTSSKSSNMKHLECQNYTIEDKGGAGGDDRGRGRGGADRYGGGGGSGQNWVEKKDYKPNVRLEYIDDSGRKLNQKEAFRHLSHKFHGKGSGKLKSEKRMKQIDEKNMIIGMSSTDTPLNTLAKLRDRQKQAATPYVILSGNKVQATNLKK